MKILKYLIIILIVIIGGYLVFTNLFMGYNSYDMVDKMLQDRVDKLKRYITLAGRTPSAETVDELKKEKTSLVEQYDNLRLFIDPPELLLPEDTQEAGLYFIEKLHSVEKSIRQQADNKGILLPDNFGFAEELPDDDRVEILLRQLSLTEKVVGSLIKHNVSTVLLIKPLEITEQLVSAEEFLYKEIPVKIGIKCDTASLIKFLCELSNHSGVEIVKDIKIKSLEFPNLEVEFVVASIMVNRE